MANPFYNAPKGNVGAPDFIKFMKYMKGKDPHAIINDFVKSGKVNQNQLNIIQQKAKEFSGVFDGFKSMFDFK